MTTWTHPSQDYWLCDEDIYYYELYNDNDILVTIIIQTMNEWMNANEMIMVTSPRSITRYRHSSIIDMQIEDPHSREKNEDSKHAFI